MSTSLNRGATGGRGLAAAWLAVLVLALASAQATAQQPAREAGYRIGPKDLIEIKVFEVPELNIERRVEENGALALPLIGEVDVKGLTANELAERLRVLLEARYIQRASVAVAVREFRSRPISVIGAVGKPGNLDFSGRWTLLEAIAAAGGLAGNHGSSIYVLRRAENGLSDQITIDVRELMVEARAEVNIPVFAGDLINIPATIDVTVFCLGAVERPGALTFRSTERITLLAAIARAGGLTERASHSIVIRRADREGRETEIEAHYKRIVSGKQHDPPLQANDVVVVKESFF